MNVSQKTELEIGKINLGRASIILICVTRANKTGTYIKGGKKKLKPLDNSVLKGMFHIRTAKTRLR